MTISEGSHDKINFFVEASDTGPGGSESPTVEAAAYIRPEGHDQPWQASVTDNTRPWQLFKVGMAIE